MQGMYDYLWTVTGPPGLAGIALGRAKPNAEVQTKDFGANDSFLRLSAGTDWIKQQTSEIDAKKNGRLRRSQRPSL